MNRPVIIIGAGGHAAVVADALMACGIEVVGFTDLDPRRQGGRHVGLPVLGADEHVLSAYRQDDIMLANGIGGIGATELRQKVQTGLQQTGWRFMTVQHPSAIVSPKAQIGPGADLVSIFVALETITIPTFVLAGWKKHDEGSNEAAIKYFLIGVLSTAVMLYGMSIIYGETGGQTLLSEISRYIANHDTTAMFAVAIFLTIGGFAFKVGAVPFHFWTPDTYVGAPTPVTSFLSVASKAGGFVALLTIVRYGFFPSQDSWEPALWVLAAASMLYGNLVALRQTDIVRMLAYSSIAQGGFILVPLAVAGDGNAATASFEAVVIYLLIYGAMNLGAFAVVIAVARRTRSTAIESYSGLGQAMPGLAVTMSIFMFSLAGIPPFAGWFAKFVMFRAVFSADTPSAVVLGVIAAVMSVVAFFYYAKVVRAMWFHAPSTELQQLPPRSVTPALSVAIGIAAVVVVVVGVYPQLFARVGELAFQV